MSERRRYPAVEVRAGASWTGTAKKEKVQQVLNRHGAQGWELINAVMSSAPSPAMLVFKKEA